MAYQDETGRHRVGPAPQRNTTTYGGKQDTFIDETGRHTGTPPPPKQKGFDWGKLRPPKGYGQGGKTEAPPGPGYDPSWMDLSKPGDFEDWYGQMDWDKPNAMQDYWEGVQGRYAGGPQKTDFIGDYANTFDPRQQSYSEQLWGTGAGLNPYYDEQSRRGNQSLANTMRATGFGGSAHADALSDFQLGLSGEQANREADFRQRQATEAGRGRMDRTRMGLDFGTARDKQKEAWERLGLDYLSGGVDAATAASKESRADDEFQGKSASTAQTHKEGRIQQVFDNESDANKFMAGLYGDGSRVNFDADYRTFNDMNESDLAAVAAKHNLSRQDQSDLMDWLATGINVAEAVNNIKTGKAPPAKSG